MFIPDVRNRGRPRKADSQRRWPGKLDNTGYFSGPANSARSRAWQAEHPD